MGSRASMSSEEEAFRCRRLRGGDPSSETGADVPVSCSLVSNAGSLGWFAGTPVCSLRVLDFVLDLVCMFLLPFGRPRTVFLDDVPTGVTSVAWVVVVLEVGAEVDGADGKPR